MNNFIENNRKESNVKNKVELKRTITNIIAVVIIFTVGFGALLYMQYRTYNVNFNEKISQICGKIIEKYPEVEKRELIELLNDTASKKDKVNIQNSINEVVTINTILREYGIDLEKDTVLLANDKEFNRFIIADITVIILSFFVIIFVFMRYNKNRNKKLNEITNYIEQINKGNYKLDIEDNTEDELSILKNELYKTTIMLKEVAENSLNDKIELKDSLSDISHQLKTPITSILIMLDNIQDNKEMDKETKSEFIKDIKREVINVRFLVESLLKLSKIDSNSINFINKEVTIREIIDEAIKNVEMLGELHNVKIQVVGNATDTIICDLKWQVEAITNILKNAIEHSNENGAIEIRYEKNKLYAKIEIEDHGIGIDEADIPHIFERFYKGKDSSSESVGIGLALSKSIIESSNGYIQVDSEKNKGSKFTIKYLE